MGPKRKDLLLSKSNFTWVGKLSHFVLGSTTTKSEPRRCWSGFLHEGESWNKKRAADAICNSFYFLK
jgi:hypothetical protein